VGSIPISRSIKMTYSKEELQELVNLTEWPYFAKAHMPGEFNDFRDPIKPATRTQVLHYYVWLSLFTSYRTHAIICPNRSDLVRSFIDEYKSVSQSLSGILSRFRPILDKKLTNSTRVQLENGSRIVGCTNLAHTGGTSFTTVAMLELYKNDRERDEWRAEMNIMRVMGASIILIEQ
jgi:hypothetical protein